jgi:TonB-linked SusC/RagA family outer membrane protein
MKKRPLSIRTGMERCRLKKTMLTAKITLFLAMLSFGNLMAEDIHNITQDRIITDAPVIKEHPVKKGLSVDEKAQEVNIRGTVTDANTGEPLPGVNIVVEGTASGTTSDANGSYSVTVPDTEATLLFSFIGYITESVAVGNQNVINVQLVPEIKTLEEIVVIGYGTTTRKYFTGSTTTKKVEDSPLALIPNTDVMDVLRGIVPGLTVSQQQGAGRSPELLIRGQKSIKAKATDPLIVLNGIIFMGHIRDIDPSTIESINVLKDAASVAAYGSRAANGVIMINTLKGKIGKPVITFKSSYGISKVINKADVLSPEDWIRKVNSLQGLEEDADPTSWMSDFEDENYANGTTTDWQDYSERTGHTQNYSLSLSGAGERMNYYLAGSYAKTQGVLIGDDYDRKAITSSLTTDITDWLEVGGNINFSYNDYSGPTNYDIYQAIRMTPYGRIYWDEENGLLEKYPATEGLWRINPLWNINSGTIDDHDVYYTTILDGHSLIKFPWIEGLSYRLNYSYTYRSIERDYFTHEGYYIPEGTSDERYSPTTIANFLTNANGYCERTKDLAWVWDNIINFKRLFGRHSIDITGVYTRDSYTYKFKRVEGSDFSELGNTALSYNGLIFGQNQNLSFTDHTNTRKDNTEKTNIGYLGRINYSYDNKYHLTASVRRDGASVFGEDNKWGVFPSFGVAWTLTEESFMNNIEAINYLKLKFSWGINGNQSLDPYRTLSTLRLGQSGEYSYPFGNTSQASWGQRINRLGNTYLKWEETTALNGGFELNIFNNRIGLNMDAYYSKTADQIFERNIPVMGAGITEIDATMGQVDNWGIEGTLNTQNIKNSDVIWNSSFIFYMNRNKLVELYGDGKDDISDTLFIGESLGAIYGYKEDGIIQEEGDEDYISINGGFPGDVKFWDRDGNDTINDNDKGIIGFKKEIFRLSFANTITYKNFELYALITGIFGGKDYYKAVNLYAYRTMSDLIWDNNFDHIWWTPENKSNTYPRVGYANRDYTPLQSRTFVRLQNVSLSYSFRQSWIKKFKIDILKLYVSATNLFTITGWEGGDPETGQTLNAIGYGYGYPLSSVYSMGINLTF